MTDLKETMRMNLLKAMDDYIRECINDEELIAHWLTMGIADGDAETEEGLMEYTSDEIFFDCVRAFDTCCELDLKGF